MNVATNQRGQALIETVCAAPIVAIVIALGIYLMYLAFAQAWMARSAREAAACLVTNVSPARCRTRLETTLAVGILLGRANIDEFRTGERGSHVQVSFDAQTSFLLPENAARSPARLTAKSSFPRRL